MRKSSRRNVLLSAGPIAVGAFAGCIGRDDTRDFDDFTGEGGNDTELDGGTQTAESEDEDSESESDDRDQTLESDDDGNALPLSDTPIYVSYSTGELTDVARSGGPPPDGIPAIEDPVFTSPDDPPSQLRPEDPIFGVEIDGDVRAYPQYILVWHEIVNDIVGDVPVSVTYCPLTGTAQGFHRGETSFGVSGQLINTNLVMFDRATGSWWPQMLAWGIDGEHQGDFLREFQVIWTTWEQWEQKYPDTAVLTEDTGHARNYGHDPYGSYAPRSGYYENDNFLFPPLVENDRFHPKKVVIGMRNEHGAFCILKDSIRERGVIDGSIDDIPYVSVYDETLDTAFVYENPDDLEIKRVNGEYDVDNEAYPADSLPLEREIVYDAMWAAWYGYYPSTDVFE